jgi:hypothetical protein
MLSNIAYEQLLCIMIIIVLSMSQTNNEITSFAIATML